MTRSAALLGVTLLLGACEVEPGLELIDGAWRIHAVIPGAWDRYEDIQIDLNHEVVTFTDIAGGAMGASSGKWSGTIEGRAADFHLQIDRAGAPDPAETCRRVQQLEQYAGAVSGENLKGRYTRSIRWEGSTCDESQPTSDPTPEVGSFLAIPLSVAMEPLDAGSVDSGDGG